MSNVEKLLEPMRKIFTIEHDSGMAVYARFLSYIESLQLQCNSNKRSNNHVASIPQVLPTTTMAVNSNTNHSQDSLDISAQPTTQSSDNTESARNENSHVDDTSAAMIVDVTDEMRSSQDSCTDMIDEATEADANTQSDKHDSAMFKVPSVPKKAEGENENEEKTEEETRREQQRIRMEQQRAKRAAKEKRIQEAKQQANAIRNSNNHDSQSETKDTDNEGTDSAETGIVLSQAVCDLVVAQVVQFLNTYQEPVQASYMQEKRCWAV